MRDETKERKEVPFFARFLEGQSFPRVKSDIKAGWPPLMHTLKWPSDDDDDDYVVVIKFP